MADRQRTAAILGPTGYTGLELVEILARHPALELGWLASARDPAPRLDEEFPRLTGMVGRSLQCEPIDHDRIAERCGIAFLCLPHEAAMARTPPLLGRDVKVVDLSAAYRLRDPVVYEDYYGHPHTDADGRERAVYGLTEWTRDQVRGATLVANPGCYPTAAAMALIPILRAGLVDPSTLIINAASGAGGAGRAPKQNLHIVEADENYNAYGVGVHRHQPEIAQTLRDYGGMPTKTRDPLFVPHLLPVRRGILETIYGEPTDGATTGGDLLDLLEQTYRDEPFIHVRATAPTLRDVQGTNNVHVHATVVGGRMVLIVAEDNLLKGASGQAIQNANLMLGLPETQGLL